MIRNLFIICLITLFALKTQCQDTLSLRASKDTYINTVIPDLPQGHVQSLIAAGWTYGGTFGQGRSLIAFEMCEIPNSFILESATLKLYHDYSASHSGHTTNGNNNAKVYSIESFWDESTTCSNQPNFDLNTFATIASSTTSNQDYTIDVTNIVASLISSSNEIGFYFKLDDEKSYRSLVFASKDHPDISIRPQLELVYYADTEICDTTTSSEIDNSPEKCISNIIIPNVFTPNKDYTNDYYRIISNCEFDSFQISILNRWGNLVYESKSADFIWDGTNSQNEKNVPEGTYFYKIIFRQNETDLIKTGFITLIR